LINGGRFVFSFIASPTFWHLRKFATSNDFPDDYSTYDHHPKAKIAQPLRFTFYALCSIH
jgi:hypothetical protein